MEQNCASWRYSGDEYVASLGFAKLKKLSDILDPTNQKSNWPWWKELAEKIPGVAYNGTDIYRMGANCRDGNAAYSFLMDLSNRSVQLDQLVSGLKAIEMNEALRELGYQEKVKVVEQPLSMITAEHGSVTLKCKATGFPPPTHQWFKERDQLPGETSPLITMDNIRLDQAGKYICRVMNRFGVDFSKWVEVKVSQPLQNIRTLQPRPSQRRTSLVVIQQLPVELSVHFGSELRLQLQLGGQGCDRLQYDWFRDGQKIATTMDGEYYVDQAMEYHHGVYGCSAHNDTDSIVSNECLVTIVSSQYSPHHYHHSNHQSNYHDDGVSLSGDPMYYTEHLPTSSYHLPPDHDSVSAYHLPPDHDSINGAAMPASTMQWHLRGKKHLDNGGSPVPEQASSPDPNRLHRREVDDQDKPSGQPTPLLESTPTLVDLTEPCADKVALLIGNKQYRETEMPSLRTPEMDTQDLAGALLSLDFKVVSLVNLTKTEMDQALAFFLGLLGANVYALFFFAGHGFQSNGQNYLMGVDSTLAKDPRYCLCAQDIRAGMQHCGAKVSIMLLDMCRVAASTHPGFNIYPSPLPTEGTHHYNSYFVMGFACSTNGEAYESKDTLIRNSYFITEIINDLNRNHPAQKEKIDIFLNRVCEGVYRSRPGDMGSTEPWQKPEIQSNLGEQLSLFDEIQPTIFSAERTEQGRAWKCAHMVPEPIILHTDDCQVVIRLQFGAEHSNVLVVMVENLNGCSSTTTIHHIAMELRSICAAQAEKTMVVPTHQYQDKDMSYQFAKEQGVNNLTHFRITELQKLQHPVVLQVKVNYSYETSGCHGNNSKNKVEQVISHELVDPPLYARTVNMITRLQ